MFMVYWSSSSTPGISGERAFRLKMVVLCALAYQFTEFSGGESGDGTAAGVAALADSRDFLLLWFGVDGRGVIGIHCSQEPSSK